MWKSVTDNKAKDIYLALCGYVTSIFSKICCCTLNSLVSWIYLRTVYLNHIFVWVLYFDFPSFNKILTTCVGTLSQ